MKPQSLMRIAAVTLFSALIVPAQSVGQDTAQSMHGQRHYKLIDPGAFGGPMT